MNRLLINLIAFFIGVGAVLCWAKAISADLGLDTPVPENRMPVASETTLCDELNPQGKKVIWYVVVSFANGDTLVFNAHHLHGAATDAEAIEYIRSAKAQTERIAVCPPQLEDTK